LSPPTEAAEEQLVISAAQTNDEKYSTSAELLVNDIPVTCLLDGGSPTTMVSAKFARTCHISPVPLKDARRWVSAQGERMIVLGRGLAMCKFGKVPMEIEVIIVEGLVHDVLIGTDVMTRNGFDVDYKNRQLNVHDQKLPIKAIGYDEAMTVYLPEDVKLPAHTQLKVWVNAPIKGSFMVEANDWGRVEVMEGLHTAADDDKFVVTLRNTYARPVALKAGSVVCDVTSVEVEGFLAEANGNPLMINSMQAAEEFKPSATAVIDDRNMSAEMASRYRRLIDANASIFSNGDKDIGASKFTHDIKLTEDTPFKARPYRLPKAQVEIVEEHVKSMLDMGVIQPSSSPYASPIVLVKKNDGTIRFCVDYRKLNMITVKDRFPMPLIEERIDSIFGSKVFSGLDLTSGYWQFAMTASATQLTAFICHMGLFEFLRMPFGLCNAGATFQRAMESVLKGLSFAMAYIDDVLIHSKSHEEHLIHLQAVFDRLRKHELKIKLKKCTFGFRETKFLGYIVSAEGIRMNKEKIDKIVNYPTPKSARLTRKFNGLSSYFSDFIPDYVKLNEPLQKAALMSTKDPVTKKRISRKFEWTPECQAAFDKLKELIARAPILIHPDSAKPFRLITDASNHGLGAILVQLDDKGVERVVCFAGRVLTEAEKNYSTGERELLAIRWAIRKFRCYLYGEAFEVHTDHKPIVHCKTAKNPSDRMLKWILELEEYNASYFYRPGKRNVPADVLSRLSEPMEVESINWYTRVKSVATLEAEQIKARQETSGMLVGSDDEDELEVLSVQRTSDDDLNRVSRVHEVTADKVSKEQLKAAQAIDKDIRAVLDKANGQSIFKQDKEGLVYMRGKAGQCRLLVPKCLRRYVLSACHDDMAGAHLGWLKKLDKVSERFFWSGMAKDVRAYVSACEKCNQRKTTRQPRAPNLRALPTVKNPFDRVAMDFVGPLPTTKNGNKYILVFIDYCTRWPEAFATKDMKATTVAEIFVKEILCRHRAPVELLSDQGRNKYSNTIEIFNKFLTKTKT